MSFKDMPSTWTFFLKTHLVREHPKLDKHLSYRH